MKLICIDLETTGVDIATCEVVQVGGIEVDTDADSQWVGVPKTMLCKSRQPIPASATAVHGITDADVVDKPHFGQIAESVMGWLDGAVVVTFNGAAFDLPIIGRHAPGVRVTYRHIDVWRLWARCKIEDVRGPWLASTSTPAVTASVMAGSLQASHVWWCGHMFDGAHDAVADCRATLDVLRSMIEQRHVTLETAMEWSSQPLPGDVDFSGKLKWYGDEVVFAFGKHKNKPVSGELGARGYVSWMLGAGDFPADTCEILRAMKSGIFPKREKQ